MTDPGRYAIYFVPAAETMLADKGGRWLGYDVASGTAFTPPALDRLSRRRCAEITRAPRRYGFHATLKPPFRLAEGCSAKALADMTAALAKGLKRITLRGLAVGSVGDFVALVPDPEAPALAGIAAACVRALDAFRAPPDDANVGRGDGKTLSARQTALLADWGYPYVMEEYRFHLTLSGSLAADERDEVAAVARVWFGAALQEPLRIDGLSLVHQPGAAAPFQVRARFPLAA